MLRHCIGGTPLTTFETVLLTLLVVDSVALGVLVLIQQGKGADVGAAFGSGSANTLFGSAGSTSFLTKTTVWLAIGFFVIAFGLAYTAKQRADAVRAISLPGVVEPFDAIEDEEPGEGDDGDAESDLPDV